MLDNFSATALATTDAGWRLVVTTGPERIAATSRVDAISIT
ncbi:MAG: hypothetical protein OEX97_07790 [Acidimicrobiia bacterium]|nr:hypothetical protein [Acidimicrobiia bacterium]